MITALTRACTICHTVLPDGELPACTHCGRIAAPRHTEWPAALKWWLVRELLRRHLHSWITEQVLWERMLRDALTGATKGPNPYGLPISTATPVAELYPLALERATAWRLAGSEIVPAVPATRRIA